MEAGEAVAPTADGLERRRLDAAPLAELDSWLAHYRGFWTNRLDAIDTEIRRRRKGTP